MAFRWPKEALRDKAREKIYSGLCAIGIPARLAEKGRPEEAFGKGQGKSLGLIDIEEGPVRWINILGVSSTAPDGAA